MKLAEEVKNTSQPRRGETDSLPNLAVHVLDVCADVKLMERPVIMQAFVVQRKALQL